MKHFIVELTYKVSEEQMLGFRTAHRSFLQTGYDAGKLLLSGTQNPPKGGVIVARADSLEVLEAFFEDDPYRKNGIADYRFIEFNPVKFYPMLQDWVEGK